MVFGALLFIGGPILATLAGCWGLRADANDDDGPWAMVGFAGGFITMFVGIFLIAAAQSAAG